MTERLFYRHYHMPEVESKSLTFAIMVDSADPNRFTFAWSMCQPEDNFSRKTGREIASNRFASGDKLTGIRNHNRPLIQDILDTITDYMERDYDLLGEINPFHMETVDALEYYHRLEEIAHDLNDTLYRVSLPWHKRIMLWFFEKTFVAKLLGW